MLENAAESPAFSARFVGRIHGTPDSKPENQNRRQPDNILHATLILTRTKNLDLPECPKQKNRLGESKPPLKALE
jgi:hypothetical protein